MLRHQATYAYEGTATPLASSRMGSWKCLFIQVDPNLEAS